MTVKLLLMFVAMVALGAITCRWIGWEYPLAATETALFRPRSALIALVVIEIIWTMLNCVALFTVRAYWKSPGTVTNAFCGLFVVLSIVAQVFLGHLAFRDLNGLMMDWKS